MKAQLDAAYIQGSEFWLINRFRLWLLGKRLQSVWPRCSSHNLMNFCRT
jgi:hypothetical protein